MTQNSEIFFLMPDQIAAMSTLMNDYRAVAGLYHNFETNLIYRENRNPRFAAAIDPIYAADTARDRELLGRLLEQYRNRDEALVSYVPTGLYTPVRWLVPNSRSAAKNLSQMFDRAANILAEALPAPKSRGFWARLRTIIPL